METNVFEHVIGKTPKGVHYDECDFKIIFDDNSELLLHHMQSCCESVYIEDIVGEPTLLIGYPLQVAEERVGGIEDSDYGILQYTYYTFRNIKESVDIRFCGESNDYYSVDVDVTYKEPKVSKLVFAYSCEVVDELSYEGNYIHVGDMDIFNKGKYLDKCINDGNDVIVTDLHLFSTCHSEIDNMYIVNKHGKLLPLRSLTQRELRMGHNIPKLLIANGFGNSEDWDKM